MLMKNVKYVQFEPDAFLTDMDFQLMNAEERGVFFTLILYLYCSGGKCQFDKEKLRVVSNCENFEAVWGKIAKKFQLKNSVLRHKRVSKELRKARQFIQRQRKAGLASAAKRSRGSANVRRPVQPGNVKRNGIEETQSNNSEGNEFVKLSSALSSSNSLLQSHVSSNSVRLDSSPSLATRALKFNECLRQILPVRTQSDRTAFRNIGNWLMVQIQAGRFTDDIFPHVLEYAAEAVKGRSRNPAAVFTSILKRELGYKPD